MMASSVVNVLVFLLRLFSFPGRIREKRKTHNKIK